MGERGHGKQMEGWTASTSPADTLHNNTQLLLRGLDGRDRGAILGCLGLSKHADEGCEQPFDILCCLCAGLHEFTAELASHGSALVPRDLTFILLVRFVTDKHKYWLLALHAHHRLSEDFEAVKCCAGGDRVDEDKALALAGETSQ